MGVLLLGFALLYAVFRWEGFLWIGGILGLPSVVFPVVRKYVLRGWFAFAKLLGAVNSRIILGIVFYCLLTPLALIRRLFQRDKNRYRQGDSYFQKRDHLFNRKDFENPW